MDAELPGLWDIKYSAAFVPMSVWSLPSLAGLAFASRLLATFKQGALKAQVQHFSGRMLHGKKLLSVEY